MTACVRRSGRGWEASFKARCSSGEGGLFYNNLFGVFFFFFNFFFFFFSQGNNLKKKKKREGQQQQTPAREGEGEMGRGKARQVGGRRDRHRRPGCPERFAGKGQGKRGRSLSAASPAQPWVRPEVFGTRNCPVPISSVPSFSFPRLSPSGDEGEKEVAGFWTLLFVVF